MYYEEFQSVRDTIQRGFPMFTYLALWRVSVSEGHDTEGISHVYVPRSVKSFSQWGSRYRGDFPCLRTSLCEEFQSVRDTIQRGFPMFTYLALWRVSVSEGHDTKGISYLYIPGSVKSSNQWGTRYGGDFPCLRTSLSEEFQSVRDTVRRGFPSFSQMTGLASSCRHSRLKASPISSLTGPCGGSAIIVVSEKQVTFYVRGYTQ